MYFEQTWRILLFLTECEWQDERCHKCNHVSTTNQSVSPFPHKKYSQFANTHILSCPLSIIHTNTHFLSHATYTLFHSVTHTHKHIHKHTVSLCYIHTHLHTTWTNTNRTLCCTHTHTYTFSLNRAHIFSAM